MRCLIVDDSAEFLESASLLLESQGMTIVGCASCRADALQLVRTSEADVFLVDVELGDEDGLALAQELGALSPRARVVLISAYEIDDLDGLIAGSGAAGFLHKRALAAAAIRSLAG
jgi:DNA-binding NarL/FixJ family response regulator